jgi:predicted nucleic acid-binding protein
MSVVVSDTSPLHYLILCGAEAILPKLFQQVVIPPAVFAELQQSNTPPPVKKWADALPKWVAVQSPEHLQTGLDVDRGELEAISLAREIHAAAVLMDDLAGRRAATQCGLAVVGTVGLLEEAANRGLIDLPSMMGQLQKTNARLDAKLIQAVLQRHQARIKKM